MNIEELAEEVKWLVGSIKDPEKRECTLEDLAVIDSKSVSIALTQVKSSSPL